MSDIEKEYESVNKELQDKCLNIMTDELNKNDTYKRPRCSRTRKQKLDDRAHLAELESIENDYINGYD